MANQPTDESEFIDSSILLRTNSDLEYVLISDIRIRPNDKLVGQPWSSTRALLNRLIFYLPAMLELSSDDGFLRIVFVKRSMGSRQIDEMNHAKMDCVSSPELIWGWLKKVSPNAAMSKKLKPVLWEWIASLSVMRWRENSIFQEAFAINAGGEV